MTTFTLPLSNRDFIPNLPPITRDSNNFFSKPIEWVRSADAKGLIQRVCIYIIAIFTSFFLICSIVLSPLFIAAYKEYIRQCERAYYDKAYENLLEVATQKAKMEFLKGRIVPLESIRIKLNPATRKLMIKNLEIPAKEAKDKTDFDLLIMAAAKYDDYIVRYRLNLVS